MNLLQISIRNLKRDLQAGELWMIFIAIFIAVSALTTTGFFTDRVKRAAELQATELLAADLVLRDNRPIDPELILSAQQMDLVTTRTVQFRSVAVAGEKLELSEVKAVESGYPIRGKMRVTESLFGAESVTDEIPTSGTVWVDSRLLQTLGLTLNDSLSLGSKTFQVEKFLTYEPDRGGDLFNIAPRIMMNLGDLAGTGLILPGSRASYRLLLGGEIAAIEKFRSSIDADQNDHLRVQDIRDARPELKTALDRTEQFLGLSVIISIALAGLAIAMSAQRYATRHFDHCAIMRCLGTQQDDILKIYSLQLILLALLGSIPGCVAGYLLQEFLANLMAGMVKGSLPDPGWMPVMQGLFAGLITLLGFALPQLLRLQQVTPLRVLRKDLTPLPPNSITTYGLAILALVILMPWQTTNIKMTVYALGGLLLSAVLLVIGARMLIKFIDRSRSRVGIAARYGIANIARRPNQSTMQILGIGLGIMVILLLTLVRTDLLDSWKQRLPDGAPNYFLINMQAEDIAPLKQFIHSNTGMEIDTFPMIRGRLIKINNNHVKPEEYNDDRAQRLARREFNLSQSAIMQADNRLTQGNWWSGDEQEVLFSVEEGIAETLGIKLHDQLTYDIGGITLTGTVSNLRWVEWDSFNVNFFVIANPGTLNRFPNTYITSFHLDNNQKPLLTEIVRNWPNITIIDVDAILGEVRKIMDQVTGAIEFVFIFTLLAGIVVLAAALQTTHDQRMQESALLFALGAGRQQIIQSLLAEFLCLGLIAGILAAFAATLVEMLMAEFVFKMDIVINPWLWIIAPAICTLIIIVTGLAGTRRVYNSPPLLTLRQA